MTVRISIEDHPLLDAAAFTAETPQPLAEMASPPDLLALLDLEAQAPFEREETLRQAVRDLLRHGGYRPTGRGKPASEYLVKAVGDGRLGSINPVVDACNVASLHSGLPISVVDLDRADGSLSIRIAAPDTEYVFNQGGQSIDVSGLLCLFDGQGPCANAVKDSQRTKTSGSTQHVLAVVWGTRSSEGRAAAVADWYRQLFDAMGIATADVALDRA